MTLQEYLKQEDPVRFPYVELSDSEFEIVDTVKISFQTRRYIKIPLLWERFNIDRNYISINDSVNLWVEKDGGTLDMSCFRLPKTKEVSHE